MKRLLPVLLCCLCLWSCAARPERSALTPYDANCLRNLQLGRDYTAQGRYELAKEHYLLALASSDDAETRNIIAHDLRSVEMMLKTQR